MRGRRGSRAGLVASLLAGLLVAACSSTIGGQPQAVDRDAVATATGPTISTAGVGSPAAVARFGYGPPERAGVRYRPDVVLIGTGPDAIKGVSPDGMVWTMDGSAPGVRDLAVGKVMFASSIAVGRVAALAAVNQDIDVSKMAPHAYPQGLEVQSAKDGTFVKPSPYGYI